MNIDAREIWLKDGEKLILKSPQPTEAERVLDFLKDVAATYYQNMNHTAEDWVAFSVEKEAGILDAFSKATNRFMISAFDKDGRIVGNIGVFGVDGRFHSHNARIGMGVREKYQNRGLGSQLMRTAILEAEKAGFKRLELNVRTYNQPGIRLYESVGFKKVGTLTEVAHIDGKYADEFMYEMKI